MNRYLHLSVLTFLITISSGFGQKPLKSTLLLGYTQTLNGLTVPTFESGRSDFCLFDINQDGHPDILSIGDHGNPNIGATEEGIMVWLGNGNGGFTYHHYGDLGYGGITAGDLNNDGLMDIGYGMHHNYSSDDLGDQILEAALGDGTGLFWTAWDDGLATNGEDWGMFGTDFADFDNDGDLDIASNSFGSGAGIHVYLNQLNGTWIQSYGFLNGNSDMILRAADFNNDGNMDFLAGHQYGTAYMGDGSGNFTVVNNGLPPIGNIAHDGISTGDVNHDGASDLAFVNSGQGLEVYAFDPVFQVWYELSGDLPATGDFQFTQLADMNSDGNCDIIGIGNGLCKVWLGDGTGNWTPDAQFTFPSPGYVEAFRAGADFDHNGFADMVFLAEQGNWPSEINKLYCFLESSPADSLWISPAFPAGGEKLKPGSVRIVRWMSEIPAGTSSNVTLEISAFGPEGPWWLVAENLPNNGQYQWLVPETGSQDCYIRFTVNNGFSQASSVTASAFTISGEPTEIISQDMNRDLIFPNPGYDQIKVRDHTIKKMTFYNLKGSAVTVVVNGNDPLDLSFLEPGVYLVELEFLNGDRSRQKWVKL